MVGVVSWWLRGRVDRWRSNVNVELRQLINEVEGLRGDWSGVLMWLNRFQVALAKALVA